MSRDSGTEIPERFTIYLPEDQDREVLAEIMWLFGTSQSGAVRIALRYWGRMYQRMQQSLEEEDDEPGGEGL